MSRRAEPAPAARSPAAVGLADLVWAFRQGGDPALRRTARLLGYREEEEVAESAVVEPGSAPGLAVSGEAVARLGTPERFAPVPYWRLERVEWHDAEGEEPMAPEVEALTEEQVLASRARQAPRAPSLAPWARLRSRLRPSFASPGQGGEIDVRLLVDRWSRGQVLARIPRVAVRSWSRRVVVLVDRDLRLVPFWDDQERLCSQLRREVGATAVQVYRQAAGSRGRWRREGKLAESPLPEVAPGDAVFALTDLGSYAGAEERRAWDRLGRRLRRMEAPLRAAVPCPEGRWHPALARLWRATDWSCPAAAVPVAGRSDQGQRAERLLKLAAPAARVEPELLRELRRLLPAGEADLGAEADAWFHPALVKTSLRAAYLEPHSARAWFEAFCVEPEETRRGVVGALRKRHKLQVPEIWYLELLGLMVAEALPAGAATPEEEEEALLFLARATAALALEPSAPSRFGRSLARWFVRALSALPALAGRHPRLGPILTKAADLLIEIDPAAAIPPGVALPQRRRNREPRRWRLLHAGDVLSLQAATDAKALPAPGSPLAAFVTPAAELVVREGGSGWGRVMELEAAAEGLHVPIRPLVLHTDRQELHLARYEREAWANAGAGRDKFGLWAAFEAGGVEHRFRWVPPGRFWMGSPESEQGRWEDEGPRHLVTLTEGFWLGEAPVTQALWKAVTGENPIRFASPDSGNHPVEQVSWDDCQAFLGKLEARVAGLGARLPTEAEWEHACRAGTETSTYAGELEIEEGKADLLESIAWYRANSGGSKQPVMGKAPNSWGLYDMLGNVWEWCEDWQGDYAVGALVDPKGPARGSGRVIRGGSWSNVARYVRSAARLWIAPSYRNDYLGFRLARGQGAQAVGGAPEPGGQARGRGAPASGEGRAGAGARRPRGQAKGKRRG